MREKIIERPTKEDIQWLYKCQGSDNYKLDTYVNPPRVIDIKHNKEIYIFHMFSRDIFIWLLDNLGIRII